MNIQCEDHIPSLGAYWLQGKIVNTRCTREAKWEVSVNPPTEKHDGKIRLCDLCNSSGLVEFTRKLIG